MSPTESDDTFIETRGPTRAYRADTIKALRRE